VFISFLQQILDSGTPFAKAKLATEQRLRDSSMREVVVRSDMFQEIWLSSLVQFDWPAGKVTIFGKGDAKHRYVATDDVAEAMVRVLMAGDPPRLLVIRRSRGTDSARGCRSVRARAWTADQTQARAQTSARLWVASAAAGEAGTRLGHGPGAGRRSEDSRATDAPLQQLGIEPRMTSVYIRQAATEHRQGVTG